MTSDLQNKRTCPKCAITYDDKTAVCPLDGSTLFVKVTDPLLELASGKHSVIPSLIGMTLDNHYQLTEFLGEGGMSVVFKAKHLILNNIVAIKMLKLLPDKDDLRLKRFKQEGQALSSLSHPNIIGVLDFGILPQGIPYMVMDYVKGTSLGDFVEQGVLLDLKRSLHIFLQACDALQHAHKKGILHRDLKPRNVMIVQQDNDPDFVKVLDFGIAKLLPWAEPDKQRLTQTGEVFGSPLYMSPEQCQGRELDARSDIYAMGCVMYETLTGVPPLVGENMLDTIQKHIIDTPKPINSIREDIYIPEEFTSIIMRAMEKEPELRQQSMQELKEELAQIDFDNLSSKSPSKKWIITRSIKKFFKSKKPVSAQFIIATIACIVILLFFVFTHLTELHVKHRQAGNTAAWERYTLQGQISFHNHDYKDAEYEFTCALNEAKHFGHYDKRLTESMKNLRNTYLAANQYKQAAHIEKEITTTAKKRLLNQYKNSDANLNKLIDLSLSLVPNVYDKHKVAEYQELSDTLNNLANVCLEQGKSDKAEKLFKIALDIDEKVFGPNSWQTAIKMNNLAFFYIKENDYQKAEPLLHHALPIMQKSLGLTSSISSNTDSSSKTNSQRQVPISVWLKEYSQLLRTIEKDNEAEEVEKHIQQSH